jgi:hypothetical protein
MVWTQASLIRYYYRYHKYYYDKYHNVNLNDKQHKQNIDGEQEWLDILDYYYTIYNEPGLDLITPIEFFQMLLNIIQILIQILF